MAIISRSFSGRRSAADVKLPPGQYLTTDFPVLSAGPTPHVPFDRWEFVIDDGTNILRRWDWKSFRDLPTEIFTVDLHCVTRWSKLGTSWEGVSLDTILAEIETDAGSDQHHEHHPRLSELDEVHGAARASHPDVEHTGIGHHASTSPPCGAVSVPECGRAPRAGCGSRPCVAHAMRRIRSTSTTDVPHSAVPVSR